MRDALKLGALAVACALTWANAAEGQEGKGEPFDLVRSLQSLQDQIVQGNARAHGEQRVLLGRIAERFEALASEEWKDQRNGRAAVTFVLSGGGVRVLQKLMSSGASTGLHDKLLKGALAYGEGRRDEAMELLSGVDARTLDPGMAGHVAYVQGELAANKDVAKALGYLDDARLLSPGTIVEEAALRREIALLAAADDVDRYELLAGQYLRRFSNSLYAAGFKQQFAKAIALHTKVGHQAQFARLRSVLEGTPRPDQRTIYLTVAREALTKGSVEMARFAAAEAARLADDNGAEREQARLYEAASLIVTEDFERGVGMLGAADREQLTEADTALLDVALAIAGQVRREADQEAAEGSPPPNDAGFPEGEVVERARKTLAQVDQMLGGANR